MSNFSIRQRRPNVEFFGRVFEGPHREDHLEDSRILFASLTCEGEAFRRFKESSLVVEKCWKNWKSWKPFFYIIFTCFLGGVGLHRLNSCVPGWRELLRTCKESKVKMNVLNETANLRRTSMKCFLFASGSELWFQTLARFGKLGVEEQIQCLSFPYWNSYKYSISKVFCSFVYLYLRGALRRTCRLSTEILRGCHGAKWKILQDATEGRPRTAGKFLDVLRTTRWKVFFIALDGEWFWARLVILIVGHAKPMVFPSLFLETVLDREHFERMAPAEEYQCGDRLEWSLLHLGRRCYGVFWCCKSCGDS